MLLPFAYLFSESSGFSGHKKGILNRVYETFMVLSLLAVVVLGLTYVISALLDRERSGLRAFLSKIICTQIFCDTNVLCNSRPWNLPSTIFVLLHIVFRSYIIIR